MKIECRSWLLLVVLVLSSTPEIAQAANPVSFEASIQPIFEQHCVSCHNDTARKGGLSLTREEFAMKGGESGAVIIPGKPTQSYLLDQIRPDGEGHAEMPKGGEALSEVERQLIEQWIENGAAWPAEIVLKEPVWWSLNSLNRPHVPLVRNSKENAVDAFLLQELHHHDLSNSKEADRRTLIRRLYFDLIGLPPTPKQIDQFIKNESQTAYRDLVDELLASPRYGERWARHWLDVVHYGDTHGYDKDKPRPNAWPYRDYVIRAFNEDKPYTQFVQEQIAGDVLFPHTQDGIEALGFIAAGPWDFIGHAEVPESKIDGKIARHLDRDDMVQNTINTFLSLTVGCAQCHDHKFDPITQRDYYSLQAVFAALDRADKIYYTDPELTEQYLALTRQQRELQSEQKRLEVDVIRLGGEELATVEQRLKELENTNKSRPAEYGLHSQVSLTQDVEKWVQLTFPEPIEVSAIELYGCHDDYNNIGAGFGFPVRFKVEGATDSEFSDPLILIDRTTADVPNPGITPQRLEFASTEVRAIRITATKLASRNKDYIFALAEAKLYAEQSDTNLASNAVLSSLDSIESPPRWRLSNLIDGLFPANEEREKQLKQLRAKRQGILEHNVPVAVQEQIVKVNQDLSEVNSQLHAMPSPEKVYSGTVHHGSGNFIGTGRNDGKPRAIHVLHRGNVTTPGEFVTPAPLNCLPGFSNSFDLKANHAEGDRRKALAKWLTDRSNPLLWRSMANRIWQYHFGTGLVSTPDDFGRMGELPSHPELLDWLACELRRTNSVKHLHRLIVTSQAYRQVSRYNKEQSAHALDVDPDNRLLWRMNRRQLEAEAVRDAMLVVAGKMDFKMYGPAFQDFVIEKPQHSPHYQFHLHDPNDPKSHRRSVYRFLVRSKTQPFMTVLDCADPSMRVATRNASLSPLQALALLNNDLSLAMSKHFAARVRYLSNDDQQRIEIAFKLATGREPLKKEIDALLDLTQLHSLDDTCRVLLNLNEFLFVD